MGRPSYKKELKNALLEAGIYEPRLDAQIALTARLEQLVRKVHERLAKVDMVYDVIMSNGMEKQEISPLLDKVMKLENQLQDAYTALGLNYNSRSANIKESVRKDAEDKPTGLSVLLGELSNVVD